MLLSTSTHGRWDGVVWGGVVLEVLVGIGSWRLMSVRQEVGESETPSLMENDTWSQMIAREMFFECGQYGIYQ